MYHIFFSYEKLGLILELMIGLRLVPALSLYLLKCGLYQFTHVCMCVCMQYMKLLKEISNKKHDVRHKDCLQCHILM